jgi:hypothetical protein
MEEKIFKIATYQLVLPFLQCEMISPMLSTTMCISFVRWVAYYIQNPLTFISTFMLPPLVEIDKSTNGSFELCASQDIANGEARQKSKYQIPPTATTTSREVAIPHNLHPQPPLTYLPPAHIRNVPSHSINANLKHCIISTTSNIPSQTIRMEPLKSKEQKTAQKSRYKAKKDNYPTSPHIPTTTLIKAPF